ncbi:MAG: hypothetical protein ACYC7E_02690 [Armatimonadota bacterium]
MLRVLFCWMLLLILLPAIAQPFNTALVLWLKADAGVLRDAQGRVSAWQDQSGNGNHFSEANPELQPLFVEQAAGEQPALRFDGVDDALTLATAPLPVAGRSVFAVVKWTEVRTYSFALGCADGTDGYLRMHSATSLLTGGRYPILYQNGLPYPKVGYTPQDATGPFHKGVNNLLQWNIFAITDNQKAKERLKHLGKNEANNVPQNRFKGEIAEIMVFDRILPAVERAQVEQYLGGKYLGWPAMISVPVREIPLAIGRAHAVPVVFSANQPYILAHGHTERPLAPGRYRVRFHLRAVSQAQDTFTVRLGGVQQTIKVPHGDRPLTEFAIDFVMPVGQPTGVALVRVSWEGALQQGATVPSQAAALNLHVQPLSPVIVSDVQVDKILYAPNQPATGTITVQNFAADAKQVQVRCLEVTGLHDRRLLGAQPAEVPAGGEMTLTFPYNVGPIEYGRELLVEVLQDGKVLDARGEPYSVSDHLWKVAIGAPNGGPIASSAPYTPKQIAGQLRTARLQYCNWFEKSFWAPDDWGVLTTPPGATWFSGQARRHENTEKLRLQIQTAHELGMKAITYGKCMAGGLPGWELARKCPQWFVVDAYGRTMGRAADVWDMEHWQEADKYQYKDYKYAWTYRWVDLRRLDALDHGIDQLIASTRQFGWDGVRFDSGGFRAHFVPKDGIVYYDGVDSVNTRNTRRMKERLWQELPGYLFGYNTNDPVGQAATQAYSPLTPADPTGHEFREMMAGGGLWMFEGMRDKSHFFGRRAYKTWSDYATDMAQAIRTIKGYGGHACFSYGDTGLYKYMIGTMIGAHDYVGEHVRANGSENWGAFLTRWSSFIWDHRLRALPAPEQAVKVTSERPLWWKEFANELVVSPTKRYVVIHLMNPPVNDECAKTKDEAPAPMTEVIVQVGHGAEKLVRAMFIAPGYPNRAETLVALDNKAGVTGFRLPRLDIWAMVVVELEGAYTMPKDAPAFTEPLSPEELAEKERCQHVYNVPTADDLLNPTPHFDPAKAVVKDFGTPTVTMPAGLRVGGDPGRDVLIIKGFYHETYRLPQALLAAGARVKECTARDLPKDHADLFQYDAVVLVNMGAEYWNANGHQRLADYARAGGRLVVFGGPFTLGQGYFKGTALEAVLPVEVRIARDVYQAPAPLPLGERKDAVLPGKPVLYFFHAIQPRPDAKPLLWAGDLPLAYERVVGQGLTRVFLGTTMGEPQAGATPFWEWKGWAALAARLALD